MIETIKQIFDNAWKENQIRKTTKEFNKIHSFLDISQKCLDLTNIEPTTLNYKCYHVIKSVNGRVVFFHVNSSSQKDVGNFKIRHLGLHLIQTKGFAPHGLRLITRHWMVEIIWE